MVVTAAQRRVIDSEGGGEQLGSMPAPPREEYPKGIQVSGNRTFEDWREALRYYLRGVQDDLYAVVGRQKIDFEGVTLRLRDDGSKPEYYLHIDPDVRGGKFPVIPGSGPTQRVSAAGTQPKDVEQALRQLAQGEKQHAVISLYDEQAGLGQLHLWNQNGELKRAFLQT